MFGVFLVLAFGIVGFACFLLFVCPYLGFWIICFEYVLVGLHFYCFTRLLAGAFVFLVLVSLLLFLFLWIHCAFVNWVFGFGLWLLVFG